MDLNSRYQPDYLRDAADALELSGQRSLVHSYLTPWTKQRHLGYLGQDMVQTKPLGPNMMWFCRIS